MLTDSTLVIPCSIIDNYDSKVGILLGASPVIDTGPVGGLLLVSIDLAHPLCSQPEVGHLVLQGDHLLLAAALNLIQLVSHFTSLAQRIKFAPRIRAW